MIEVFYKYGGMLYWYCTDFVINAANLVDASYFDMNSWLFFVAFPGVTLLLMATVLVQLIQIWRLKRS